MTWPTGRLTKGAAGLGLGVDFTEGGKPENPEKNPRSTGDTNYNTIHMSPKFEN